MELSYFDWLLLKEMGSHLDTDISSVNLEPSNHGYNYYFQVGPVGYEVHFTGPSPWDFWPERGDRVNLAKKKYSVSFSRGGSHSLPGNTKVPTAVYGEVFKAIRKLLEQEHPDALSFYGAENKQDAMYNLFYNKYLSKLFTRVGSEMYLRNDLYNKYKEENGPEWRAIEMESSESSPYLDEKLMKAKQQRDKDREKRRQRSGGITSTATAMPQQQQQVPHGWDSVPAGGGSQGARSQLYRRGARLPNGGYYVGTTPAGVDWVAYNYDDYDTMVNRFDSLYPGLNR